MNWARNRIVPAALLVAATLMTGTTTSFVGTASASEIKYVVNGTAITSYDIQRRAAFLRLQRRQGNVNQIATDDMINQALQAQELARLRIRITDEQVDAAYARFAQSNKMTLQQLDGVMSQSGVTKSHFKGYIRAQMGWGQALASRARGGGGAPGGKMTSEQEMVRKMFDKSGSKPKATEYMLQQVIFVVPPKQRGALLGQRKREAEALRARFSGCENTRQFAKGLIDVTVRDLGRVLEPALPPEWADSIKSTKTGGATTVRETERGIEFIGICRAKEVSDDRVAQLLFQKEGQANDPESDNLAKKYNEELRARAKIVQR